MDAKVEKLREWIAQSDNIVFFGGAGVSTESGIPDFRSVDGLYNQQWDYPPETILSRTFFDRDPEEYYRFHHAKLVVDGAKPNRAHLRLAELEREGKLRAEHRRAAPGGGEQKRARAAREHPARLLHALPCALPGGGHEPLPGRAALRPLRRHRAAGHRAL